MVKDKQCLKLVERFAKTIREGLGISASTEQQRREDDDDDGDDPADVSHLVDPVSMQNDKT